MSQVHSKWRVGTQVGRNLYIVDPVDPDKKAPHQYFGSVDTAELAAHIVEIHNWWLDLKRADDEFLEHAPDGPT